ncbi:SgcJ/EcaC family oxidoreductase [Bradyrhizobium sp.]|uniref:SgcJ/EcaC family oxidoreductase n=1 Tax=Bradyrhizobium sp. TaxID=376 RepID=UPI0039E66D4D
MSEAYDVVQRWAEAFNAGEADAIAALYAEGAVLWGTLGQQLTTSPAEITTYFAEAARAGLRVKLQTYVISPASDDLAIIAGHYEFSRTADGKTQPIPARYSFVLTRRNGAWMIAHQHSSLLPRPANRP